MNQRDLFNKNLFLQHIQTGLNENSCSSSYSSSDKKKKKADKLNEIYYHHRLPTINTRDIRAIHINIRRYTDDQDKLGKEKKVEDEKKKETSFSNLLRRPRPTPKIEGSPSNDSTGNSPVPDQNSKLSKKPIEGSYGSPDPSYILPSPEGRSLDPYRVPGRRLDPYRPPSPEGRRLDPYRRPDPGYRELIHKYF